MRRAFTTLRTIDTTYDCDLRKTNYTGIFKMTDNESNDSLPKAASSSNATTEEGGASIFPSSLPTLKESVRTAVDSTNRLLGDLEQRAKAAREPLQTAWHTASENGTALTAQIATALERRHEYGPAVVAGASLSTGAFVSLRRGRVFPVGALAATIAGGAAYAAVYGTTDWDKALRALPQTVADRFRQQQR